MRSLLLLMCLTFSMYSCTTEDITEIDEPLTELPQEALTCDSELPTVRLTNNGTVIHNLEIYDADMNLLISAFDLEIGASTEWFSFEPQEILVSLTNDNKPDEKLLTTMDYCTLFDMIIGGNDFLESHEVSDVQ
jgi:hypothetical protein